MFTIHGNILDSLHFLTASFVVPVVDESLSCGAGNLLPKK